MVIQILAETWIEKSRKGPILRDPRPISSVQTSTKSTQIREHVRTAGASAAIRSQSGNRTPVAARSPLGYGVTISHLAALPFSLESHYIYGCHATQPTAPTESTRVYKLYVNLSASQTRKRLQGHGLGVRKVAATDRNQSVIIHTATGRHLHDLEALFNDLTSSAWHEDLDTPVENLRHLGAPSAALLRDVNIHTRSDLARCGPTAAYQQIKNNTDTSVNTTLLWALAAALANCDPQDLDAATRRRLLEDLD